MSDRPTMVQSPVPMLLHCPLCSARHVDVGEFETKVHHTHACQGCGHVWRPAIVATVGVQFLPGFKNEAERSAVSDLFEACEVALDFLGSGSSRGRALDLPGGGDLECLLRAAIAKAKVQP